MRRGNLSNKLKTLHLREVILQKHGNNAPSTYKRNTKDVPIDGIWASIGIEITAGSYFDFDEVIANTDHRTLWVTFLIATLSDTMEEPLLLDHQHEG
jgi:hypothetical protein